MVESCGTIKHLIKLSSLGSCRDIFSLLLMIELAFRIISNVFCWWGSVEPLIKNMPPIDNQWMGLKAKASCSEGVVSRVWTHS